MRSVNALVGETNDSGLNDIRGQHVRREHVWSAIDQAKGGPVAEGCVGAGTGTACFAWKGGIGTSSRILPERFGGYRLGVLVQTNFGGVLTIAGAPVGKELGQYEFNPDSPRRRRASIEQRGSVRRAQRRLLHDRGGHRRPARRPRPQAIGRPSPLRTGANGIVLQQRQRRLRHRLHHLERATFPFRGNPSPPRRILPTDAVSPLFQARSRRPRNPSITRCSRRPRRPAPAGPSRRSPSTRSARS